MNTAALATVITGCIALTASVLGAFLVPNSPWINPEFNADVIEYQSDDTKLSHIIIQNIGWAQAKDAKAFIKLSESSLVSSNYCFEGKIEKSTLVDTYQITFDRMSTKVNCTLDFLSPISQSVQSLVVTSTGSDGYEWDRESISSVTSITSSENEKIPDVISQSEKLFWILLSIIPLTFLALILRKIDERRRQHN